MNEQINKLEGARESAYLRQVNLYKKLDYPWEHACQIWSP